MNKNPLLLSKTELAEKYDELLQPLESLVVRTYKINPQMYDLDVLKVYEALLKDIKALLTKYPMPKHSLEGISKELYSEIGEFLEPFGKKYAIEEIQACIKQLEKSVKLWSREHGSRGYLNYIEQFIFFV